MRLFVALPLPLEFTVSLQAALSDVQEHHPHLRWSQPDNLHITLAFFNEIDENGLSLLKDGVEQALKNTRGFLIKTGKLLTLPKRKPATVLALGFKTEGDALHKKVNLLEDCIAQIREQSGYPFRAREKRPFTAHITLARKGREPLNLSQEEFDLPCSLQAELKTAVIFKSELHSTGPLYTPLFVFPLQC
jgi:2'-5' RNA ligase